jgi:hypothetical protein
MSTTLTTLGKNAGLLGIGSDITGLPTNVYYDAETGKIYERPLSGGVFLEVFDPQKQTTYRSSFITDINNLDKNYQSILREKNPESEINPETRQLIEQAKNNPTIAREDPNSDSSTEGAESLGDFAREAGTNKNTRTNYGGDNKYPLNLNLNLQDCIKFSIVEYKPPGLQPGAEGSRIVTLNSSRPEIAGEGRTILGTITLPIPGGISDRNSVNWNGDRLGEITKFFAGISMGAMLGGGEGATSATEGGVATLAPNGDTSALSKTITSQLVQAATGSNGILSRQYGAVINENLELLFSGPSLRNFTFNFRFTPRKKEEAVAVRKIIRMFKQAMSVKRSESTLLLKTPHTFAISYLSKDADHPYLNKFKECALTDCAVNYTPDGTYMTYTDSSMTAYELSLTFQELVPIFDDEYPNDNDGSIGF